MKTEKEIVEIIFNRYNDGIIDCVDIAIAEGIKMYKRENEKEIKLCLKKKMENKLIIGTDRGDTSYLIFKRCWESFWKKELRKKDE